MLPKRVLQTVAGVAATCAPAVAATGQGGRGVNSRDRRIRTKSSMENTCVCSVWPLDVTCPSASRQEKKTIQTASNVRNSRRRTIMHLVAREKTWVRASNPRTCP